MTGQGEDTASAPDLSLIIPCYNEDQVVEYTVQRLLAAFAEAGHSLQIIAVDNGSTDQTADVLRRLSADEPRIRTTSVPVNEGYGLGVLTGIGLCRGRWAGIIPADGQVDAEDVVRLFDAADASDGRVLAKVRRRFRMDGLFRKLVSVSYNLFFRALWPRITSLDINGSPKILPRHDFEDMDLQSKDWILDPEIMVKARQRGLRVMEVNVFARMRGAGTSHVRATTCWSFFYRLLRMRLFGPSAGMTPTEVAEAESLVR